MLSPRPSNRRDSDPPLLDDWGSDAHCAQHAVPRLGLYFVMQRGGEGTGGGGGGKDASGWDEKMKGLKKCM